MDIPTRISLGLANALDQPRIDQVIAKVLQWRSVAVLPAHTGMIPTAAHASRLDTKIPLVPA